MRQKLDKTETERCLGIDELEGLCGTPWQMVAPELKLTKKVKADKLGDLDPSRTIGRTSVDFSTPQLSAFLDGK